MVPSPRPHCCTCPFLQSPQVLPSHAGSPAAPGRWCGSRRKPSRLLCGVRSGACSEVTAEPGRERGGPFTRPDSLESTGDVASASCLEGWLRGLDLVDLRMMLGTQECQVQAGQEASVWVFGLQKRFHQT